MTNFYRCSIAILALLAFGLLAVVVSESTAYPTYTSGNETGNCYTCHGDFNSGTYTSLTTRDGVSWGTDLMSGHQAAFGISGGSNCDVCHTGSDRGTVFIGSSDGAGGLAPLGCLGCHGRDEGSPWGVDGAGLRRHHPSFAGCSGCHTDPATPVDEIVLPPYFASPGSGNEIPTHPCNLPAQTYLEAAFGSWGLDTDGDGLYDAADDTDCASVVPVDDSTWGKIKALFE